MKTKWFYSIGAVACLVSFVALLSFSQTASARLAPDGTTTFKCKTDGTAGAVCTTDDPDPVGDGPGGSGSAEVTVVVDRVSSLGCIIFRLNGGQFPSGTNVPLRTGMHFGELVRRIGDSSAGAFSGLDLALTAAEGFQVHCFVNAAGDPWTLETKGTNLAHNLDNSITLDQVTDPVSLLKFPNGSWSFIPIGLLSDVSPGNTEDVTISASTGGADYLIGDNAVVAALPSGDTDPIKAGQGIPVDVTRDWAPWVQAVDLNGFPLQNLPPNTYAAAVYTICNDPRPPIFRGIPDASGDTKGGCSFLPAASGVPPVPGSHFFGASPALPHGTYEGEVAWRLTNNGV